MNTSKSNPMIMGSSKRFPNIESQQMWEIIEQFDLENGRGLRNDEDRYQFKQRQKFKKNKVDFIKYNEEFEKY